MSASTSKVSPSEQRVSLELHNTHKYDAYNKYLYTDYLTFLL